MRRISLLLFTVMFLVTGYVQAQNRGGGQGPQRPYSLVIKGGHVIDPKNNINEVMDIAITAVRQAVAARAAIPAQEAQPAQGNQPAIQAVPAQPAREASPALPARVALANKEYVVGFKLAPYEGADWRTPVSRVVEAGKLANMPVMIDFGGHARNGAPPSIEELFI